MAGSRDAVTTRPSVLRGVLSDLSLPQVAGTALAAVTSMLLASYIGIAGSIIGVALASVVSTVCASLYKNFLAASAERIREIPQAVHGASGAGGAPADGDADADGALDGGAAGIGAAVSGRATAATAAWGGAAAGIANPRGGAPGETAPLDLPGAARTAGPATRAASPWGGLAAGGASGASAADAGRPTATPRLGDAGVVTPGVAEALRDEQRRRVRARRGVVAVAVGRASRGAGRRRGSAGCAGRPAQAARALIARPPSSPWEPAGRGPPPQRR